MRKQSDRAGQTAPKRDPHEAVPSKKTYRSPRLVIHGDLRTLTKVKGGNSPDGGNPSGTKH